MSQRLDYFKHSSQAANKYVDFTHSLTQKPALAELGHLVMIRASQLNGCAFCVDMHVKEAKIDGERELRLYHVAVWRDSPLFNERERAALEWAEELTQLCAKGISDAAYAQVREQFSEQELSDLTFLIVAINGWNRLNVAFRAVPGTADELYGLAKANLS